MAVPLLVRGADKPDSSNPFNPSPLKTFVNIRMTRTGCHSEENHSRDSPIELSLYPETNTEARGRSQLAKTEDSPPPYHIFSKRQKWNLVLLVSLAGSLSPLSSNIYFPAIDSISSELGVNASLVSLTITVYMIVQGIAPSLFGAVSDSSGRRLTFTIVLVIYCVANMALAYTSNYPMLLVLRGVQAAGSSATISISTAVVADMAAPSERGSFMGTNAGIRYVEAMATPREEQLLTQTE